MQSTVNANGNLNVADDATVNGNTVLQGSLTANGTVDLAGSTVHVSGPVTADSDVDVAGQVTATGGVQFSDGSVQTTAAFAGVAFASAGLTELDGLGAVTQVVSVNLDAPTDGFAIIMYSFLWKSLDSHEAWDLLY